MGHSSKSKIARARKKASIVLSGVGILVAAILIAMLLPAANRTRQDAEVMELTSRRLEIVHEVQLRTEAVVGNAKILEVGGLTSGADVYIKEINEELPIIYRISKEYRESGPKPDKRISDKVFSRRLTMLLFLVEGVVDLYPNEEVSGEKVVAALEKKHKLLNEQLDVMARIEMDRLETQAMPDKEATSKTQAIAIACVAIVFVLTIILLAKRPIVFFREESLIAAAEEVLNREPEGILRDGRN